MALISGPCIYRAVFRGAGGPDPALSTGDPVGTADSSSSTAMRGDAGVKDAAATAPSDNRWVEEGEGLRAAVPRPTGSVIENARSVFAEMSSEILVRDT